MTRARRALYVYVSPDPETPSRAKSHERVLREALAPGIRASPGKVLFSSGSEAWWEPEAVEVGAGAGRPPGREAAGRLRLVPSPGRRMVPHRRASEPAVEFVPRLEQLLNAPGPGARMRNQPHSFAPGSGPSRGSRTECRTTPYSSPSLRAPASAPRASTPSSRASGGGLPATRSAGSSRVRPCPPGTRVERGIAFLVRDEGEVLEGRADRVVHIPDGRDGRLVVIA